MMRIPFDPSISADQQFQVLLPERAVLTLTLRWNSRSGFWYMDVSAGSSSLQGIKVTPRWPLLLGHKALSPIEGNLIVLPLDKSAPDPIQYDALGSAWGLFWISPEDEARWEASHGLG